MHVFLRTQVGLIYLIQHLAWLWFLAPSTSHLTSKNHQDGFFELQNYLQAFQVVQPNLSSFRTGLFEVLATNPIVVEVLPLLAKLRPSCLIYKKILGL